MNYAATYSVTLWCAALSKLGRGIEHAVSENGLPFTQFRVLLQLSRPETAAASMGRLSRLLALRPVVVQHALGQLLECGLVSCNVDDMFALTEEGMTRLGNVLPSVCAFAGAAFGTVFPEEMMLLSTMSYDGLSTPGGVFSRFDRPPLRRGCPLPLVYAITSAEQFMQVVGTVAKSAEGISFTEFHFLLELFPRRRGEKKALRAKEVAVLLGVNRPFVTTAANKLEERGLLQRIPDEHDARGVLFGLTNAGLRSVSEVVDDVSSLFEGAYGITSRQRPAADRAMKALLHGVDKALKLGDAV